MLHNYEYPYSVFIPTDKSKFNTEESIWLGQNIWLKNKTRICCFQILVETIKFDFWLINQTLLIKFSVFFKKKTLLMINIDNILGEAAIAYTNDTSVKFVRYLFKTHICSNIFSSEYLHSQM